jgi:hypothetical protein
MDLLGDVGQMQDRVKVCTEHAIDSEIVLGTLDGTPC